MNQKKVQSLVKLVAGNNFFLRNENESQKVVYSGDEPRRIEVKLIKFSAFLIVGAYADKSRNATFLNA